MISLGFLAAARYYYHLKAWTRHGFTHFVWKELTYCLFSWKICSVRVSNELGRGSSKSVKFSIMTITLTSLCIGCVTFALFLCLRGRLAYVFTESEEVGNAVVDLSPLLACSILLDSVQPVLSGKHRLHATDSGGIWVRVIFILRLSLWSYLPVECLEENDSCMETEYV